ncbi:MAG: serine/threonine-protein kinase [Mangrovibacterium sp.]
MSPIILLSDKCERFGYYHSAESRVGKGAMGEVFRGWRFDNPAEKVAIKRILPIHAQNPTIRQRAKYEASLSISHPNLIKMLGYSELNDGSIYVISEFVQGNTIGNFVKSVNGSNKIEIISRMMCMVLDALTCLHSNRIWHRDIKPSNIMVENGCTVKVMDLGIATSDGISFGTLNKGFGTYPYAPPEQVTGRREEVNGTSDLYSLGITFYELLTGNNPFDGGSEIDIMEKQVKMPLPANPLVPMPLFKVLRKATAKKQSNRYQTAEEFKQAVNEAVFNYQVFPEKTRILVLAVGILVLIILIISILYVQSIN